MINTTISRIWVLRAGETLLGVEPKTLKEVLELNSPTVVPLAPASLLGLISNQGNIVPVFDLGPSLGLQCKDFGMAALVEHQGQQLAFSVDEIVGLRSNLNGAWIQTSEHPLLSANLEIDGQQVGILDIAKVFQHLSAQMGFVEISQPIETTATA